MSTPKGIITATEARELNDNWTNLRKKETDLAAGKPDNRSSWYSLQDMEDFIAVIKRENKNVNGVRFYLGVETSKADPKGYTTIFMVPTENNGGKNSDILNAKGMDMGDAGDPPSANYPQ